MFRKCGNNFIAFELKCKQQSEPSKCFAVLIV